MKYCLYTIKKASYKITLIIHLKSDSWKVHPKKQLEISPNEKHPLSQMEIELLKSLLDKEY